MNPQFFGQFLLHRGCITADQLVAAVKLQGQVNVKIGTLAIDRGFMTAAEVQRINHLQRTVDRRFGELAISEGVLTESRLTELLAGQKHSRLLLGEALVKLGFVTESRLNEELEAFRKTQVTIPEKLSQLYSGAEHSSIVEAACDVTVKLFQRMVHFPVRPGGWVQGADALHSMDYVVTQELTGELSGCVALNLPEGIVLTIGRTMLQAELAQVDEGCLDAVMEFVNTISGNLCARLSAQGIPSGLLPPRVWSRGAAQLASAVTMISSYGSVVTTPLLHPDGRVDLLVAVRRQSSP